jgi:hypothetical protein
LSVAFGEGPVPGLSVVMMSPDAVFVAPFSAAALSRKACAAFFSTAAGRAGARRLQLRDLRRVRLNVDLELLLEDAVADARLHRFQIARVQVEGREVLTDHEPEGVERLLVFGLELGAGRAGRSDSDQDDSDGDGEGFEHRRSFLRAGYRRIGRSSHGRPGCRNRFLHR